MENLTLMPDTVQDTIQDKENVKSASCQETSHVL